MPWTRSRRFWLAFVCIVACVVASIAQETVFRPSVQLTPGEGRWNLTLIGNINSDLSTARSRSCLIDSREFDSFACAKAAATPKNSFVVYTDVQVNAMLNELKTDLNLKVTTLQSNLATLAKQNDALTKRINELKKRLATQNEERGERK